MERANIAKELGVQDGSNKPAITALADGLRLGAPARDDGHS
jgi:hypothetical protein